MNPASRSRPFLLSALGVLLLAVLALGIATTPAHAARSGLLKVPGRPDPDGRWDSSSKLQPGAMLDDSTFYTGATDPFHGNIKQFYSLDIEGGYLFVATGQGLEIFNLNDVNDATNFPTPLSYIYGWWQSDGAFPIWLFSDKDWFIKQIDAPEGNNNLVTLAMEEQGFAIVRTTDKTKPVVAYQRELQVYRTYAFNANGTNYAYATGGTNNNLYLFNLDAAANMTRCAEEPPAVSCAGVYQGLIGGFGTGVTSLAGTGTFVATGSSSRSANGGINIYNASNPAQPVKLLSIPGATLSVALWKLGTSYYAAQLDVTGQQLSIYNVSCIASGSCGTVSPVVSGQVSSTNSMLFITASVDNGKAYLYVGAEDLGLGACVPQREYLYDVTSVSAGSTLASLDMTPRNVNTDPSKGYWNWYYSNCPTGFNLIGPRIGKVSGGRLFRAAMTALDTHKITQSGPPTASFTWSPTEVYPGTPVQFTDTSSGQPTGWTWTFDSTGNTASPASSTQQNPGNVTYSSQGNKTVTLVASNSAAGAGAPVSQTLNVLNPNPVVASVTVSPPNPTVCQQITFTANGVTGRPPLTYAWNISNGSTQASGSSNPLVWNAPSTAPTGSYTAQVTVANGTVDAVTQVPFTLASLPALPGDGQFTPTNDAFAAGTVQFHVNASGATAWNWDFDGDGVFNEADWTSDPVNGPNPVHGYTTTGSRQVRVKVRNCVNQIGVVSAPLTVSVTQITPLKAQFSINALCGGGLCFATAGSPVGFSDLSTGADTWDYDWDGDGTWDSVGNSAPVTSHTYSAAGQYFPKLRVWRGGTENNIYTSTNKLLVDSASPAGISISGSTSGNVNQALSFSASGTGSCNPAANGWSWQAAGGTIGGDATGSSITVTWPSAGLKSVSATNSGCPSASAGSKSVQISSGDGGGGGGGGGGSTLTANFTFTPGSPNAGQAVSFDASSSTGSPTGYTWDFGDNSAFGSGAQASHTYAQPGTYRVQLGVTKPGNCAPAPFCEAAVTKTVVVGNGVPPLVAAYSTSAQCISELGFDSCSAQAGDVVTFTDQSTGGPTSWSWNFGDGSTATGPSATHVFTQAGTFPVTLTIGNGSSSVNKLRTFTITSPPPPPASTAVILPWAAQSASNPKQATDLYLLNPTASAMNVTLTLRRRGTPETNPPKASKTIQPGATLYVPDVVGGGLFNRQNSSGFITINVDQGSVEPVVTAFNSLPLSNGGTYSQAFSGLSMSSSGTQSAGPQVQELVGLGNNTDVNASFGVSNPGKDPLSYTVKVFDNLGKQIGTRDFVAPQLGQRQFLPKEIRTLFGVTNQDDYRVEVRNSSGQLFPFSANLQAGSNDPSFVGGVGASAQKVYLIGAMSMTGPAKMVWQSDVVLSNPTTDVVLTDMTFTGTGVTAKPTGPVHLTLQPGDTLRVADALGKQWNLRNTVGVITLDSDAPGGVFPVVQGSTYTTVGGKQFGRLMPAMTEAQAAGVNASQYLVGLRQDAKNTTTLWIFNPGSVPCVVDIIYRGLNGQELGRISGVAMNPGINRQFGSKQHKLPAAGVPDGFTVQVQVKSGKILAAAQVVNNTTNDPAYIQGVTR